jgi:copper chaperone
MLLSVQTTACNHGIRAVTVAVEALDPHGQVEVNLADGPVRVAGCTVAEAATKAIRAAGSIVRIIDWLGSGTEATHVHPERIRPDGRG